jgi:hypothetical protein
VKTLKDLTDGHMSVAVGGAMLGLFAAWPAIAQADAVTNDLTDALYALGLTGDVAQSYEYN